MGEPDVRRNMITHSPTRLSARLEMMCCRMRRASARNRVIEDSAREM
jgi:hypothetical protein